MLTGFEQASQEIRTLKDAPAALQTKTAEYRCVLPREFGEKSVTMTEDLELSTGEPEMESIVQYWVSPEITEQKLTGNKAVFKGVLTFKALYLTTDGAPETYVRQLPFSQYCELRGTYDDDELALCLCVTGSEAELSRMEDEPSKILLSVTLLCQCISMRASEVTLTEDAYATRGEFSPEWSEVRLSCLLDRQTQTGTLRGSVPKQARAVIDSTLYLGEPTQQTQNGEAVLHRSCDGEPFYTWIPGRRAAIGHCPRSGELQIALGDDVVL